MTSLTQTARAAARNGAGRVGTFVAIAILLYALQAILGVRWAATATVAGAWAVAVVGLDLLWGRAGQVSLGQGGFVAIGAYATGILTVDHAWQPVAAMAAGAAISCVLAWILGRSVLGLDELYLALATLGFGLLVPALIAVLSQHTGGPSGLFGIPDFTIAGYAFDTLFKSYVLVWGVAALAAWGALRLVSARIGLSWTVLGHHPDVASSSGVAVKKRKVEVFVVSAGLASVAGSLYAHFTHAITPETFGFPLAVLLLTYAIVGGVGTCYGPLLGAVVVNAAITYSGQTGKYTELIYGIVFLAVLYLAPFGMVGLVRRAVGAVAGFGNAPQPESAAGQKPSSSAINRLAVATPTNEPPLLLVEDVAKRFGGLQALDAVNFEARRGEVTGLVGPNGAGKTTLLNIITGLYSADSGNIRVGEADITNWRPDRRAQLGIARTFQTPSVVPDLSILNNVAIGAYRNGRQGMAASLVTPKGRRELDDMRTAAFDALVAVDLHHLASAAPDALSFGQRRRLELARAIALKPDLLLLDEPMSGLDGREKADLCELITAIAEAGTAVCLVEHDTKVVANTCRWVTVLDFGRVIARETGAAVFDNDAVRSSYMGDNVAAETEVPA